MRLISSKNTLKVNNNNHQKNTVTSIKILSEQFNKKINSQTNKKITKLANKVYLSKIKLIY
jgi:hypothetical protein